MLKRNRNIVFKDAFSLMEVLISTVLLSVVLLSLFQLKSNNISLLGKSNENKKQNDYLILSFDSENYSKRNKNIYLDKELNIQDDDIRRELKEKKINIKDEIIDSKDYKVDNIKITLNTYKTKYSFENGLSKDIYRFKLEF